MKLDLRSELERLEKTDPSKVIRRQVLDAVSMLVVISTITLISLNLSRNDGLLVLVSQLPYGPILFYSYYRARRESLFFSYAAVISSYLCVVTLTYATPYHHTDLMTFLYTMVIVLGANFFGKRGYAISAAAVALLIIVTYIISPNFKYPHEIAAALLNTCLVGAIPILLKNMYKKLWFNRMEEIKSQLLADELEFNLQTYEQSLKFTSDNSKDDLKATEISTYSSPYN